MDWPETSHLKDSGLVREIARTGKGGGVGAEGRCGSPDTFDLMLFFQASVAKIVLQVDLVETNEFEGYPAMLSPRTSDKTLITDHAEPRL